MELVRTGALRLDERVSRVLRRLARRAIARRVTVRDLLEHASGLPARLLDAPPTDAARVRARHLHDAARVRAAHAIHLQRSRVHPARLPRRGSRRAPLAEQFDRITVRLWLDRRTDVLTFDLPPELRRARGADAADGRRRAPRPRCSPARSTTTTRRRSAASPATRDCSAPRRRRRLRAHRAARRARRRRGRPPPVRRRRWSQEFTTKTAVRRQFARARLGYDAADFVVRHADVGRTRSVTSASPARRSGSIRRAIGISCCSPIAPAAAARSTRCGPCGARFTMRSADV